MKITYFDLVGGAAGDMLLAALIDAGAPQEALKAGLDRLGLGARLEVSAEERRGLVVRRVTVVPPDGPEPHRHLADVRAIIAGAGLPDRAARWATAAFEALARAEGRVHGVDPEQVHFHEVGAVDSLVDTVGVCLALDLLGVEAVEASPLPVARGTVRAAHGVIPVPAPAVLTLAAERGLPVDGRPGGGEWVTPTAAALLAAVATRFGPFPAMTVEAVGCGAGTRRNPDELPPNLVRAVIGQAAPASSRQRVVLLEANLDDQPPEQTAYLCEQLLGAGALDAFLVPVVMKKGRPGAVVTALATPERADALEALILGESSTLGVRRREATRAVLPRELQQVATPFGPVAVKLTVRPGGRRTAAPEYEDCARAARAHGVPIADVFDAARRAAEATRSPSARD